MRTRRPREPEFCMAPGRRGPQGGSPDPSRSFRRGAAPHDDLPAGGCRLGTGAPGPGDHWRAGAVDLFRAHPARARDMARRRPHRRAEAGRSPQGGRRHRVDLRRAWRHPGTGPRRPAPAHRIVDGDGLRLCRGGARQRHDDDLLRQPRDRQCHGRRRRRGDAGRRAPGAAVDLPHRTEHRARDVAGARDGRRRPHAGKDRRAV